MANAILKRTNTSSFVEAENELIDQLPALLAGQTLVINGVKMTIAQFLAPLQQHITQQQLINSKRAELKTLVAGQKGLVASNRSQVEGLKAFVASAFGTASTVYITLGFARATTRVSSTKKAAASVKSTETRKARGIMGKKQRKAIHSVPPAPATPAVAK
jgi:hypothetical protein